MKIYIAGKITGVENYKENFAAARDALLAQGHKTVLNPADLPPGLCPGEYMKICLSMIDAADMVVMIPGWGTSPGAAVEMLYATYVGKTVKELEEML